MFRSKFSETIFNQKYRHAGAETWDILSHNMVEDICSDRVTKDDKARLSQYISDMKFIPGGRYLYYACRPKKFIQNCFMLRACEDTREDWAELSYKAESCLMVGGGIGVDYSVYRKSGSVLTGTGGRASGPLAKMQMINEIGRNVMQGGSRRSAILASLNWKHGDIDQFLVAKNWDTIPVAGTNLTLADVKRSDFNFPAPLDMTNISINYDTSWIQNYYRTGDVGQVFLDNVRQALRTGEPGFSFNFFSKETETLTNACGELRSSDDSDVCNIGSLNLSRITSPRELQDVIDLAVQFLLCGSIIGDLPYPKVYAVREKNRRIGLGLMGLHEWLIQRNSRYEVTPELHRWLWIYKDASDRAASIHSARLGISEPAGKRAIAPTGSIGILAGTSTGIEPIFAVAYKRRYVANGTDWHYQYVIDSAAQDLIDRYGVDPDTVESALDLAADPERRIAFQADVQTYVDHAISSTINLPAWGTELNNEGTVDSFAKTLAKYASQLRGFTCYPDGSRGGQPITAVPYREAKSLLGKEFKESVRAVDVCDITGKGGTCGA